MRASVLGTGHWLPARARVKVGRSAHSGRQPGRQPVCMHCMQKNRLNFSDLSSDHACRILDGWLAVAGWRAAANPAQMGWKWSAGGKFMTPRARSEKKLHVVETEKPFWFQLRGPFLAYCPQTACKTAFLGLISDCAA